MILQRNIARLWRVVGLSTALALVRSISVPGLMYSANSYLPLVSDSLDVGLTPWSLFILISFLTICLLQRFDLRTVTQVGTITFSTVDSRQVLRIA